MSNSVLGLIHSSSGVSQSNNMSISDSIRRPTLRPLRHNTFAGRSLQLLGPVSAEGAFAASWLLASRVRRRCGVGLQRQHHGDLLARFEVGAA